MGELPARLNFLAWGTKAGKTTAAVLRMTKLLWETKRKRYRWIAPFYRQTEIAIERMKRVFPTGYSDWDAKRNTLIGPKGSTCSFHSGERPDTLPGEDVHGAILDEASRLREDVFNVTMSTLLATKGWMMAISTPHGRNWFYQQCKKAHAGEKGYFFKRYPSAANPLMDKEVLEQTRRSVPEFIYKEMILARFISNVSATFPPLSPMGTDTLPRNKPDPRKHYAISVDVGQIRDRNVITIWDGLDAALVSWAVAQGRDYTLIAEDIQFLSKAWNDAPAFIERNGPGLPLINMLQARGCPLGNGIDGQVGFTTSGSSKPFLVHNWGLALRNKEPMLPSREKWPELYDEHENYEYSISPRGNWTFEAASGHHDDIVMSCMIGWWAITHGVNPKWWRAGEGATKRKRKRSRRDKNILNP